MTERSGLGRRRRPKRQRPTLELCKDAADLLKAIGFELANVSMDSEACYYRWPGRTELLRIAAHGSKGAPIGIGWPVVSLLTFRGTHKDKPDHMALADEKFDQMVAQAIGWYFLRSLGAKPWPNRVRNRRQYAPQWSQDGHPGVIG